MDEKALQVKIHNKVKAKLAPLFSTYDTDLAELETMLKWKPIVLILGNYSSGKSTFINELLDRDLQRTGQAPTDDSFTIITSPDPGADEGDLTGSDLVNSDKMPFGKFKAFGERFISHLRMKKVKSPLFDNLAIIDSPGMLDSISEKDRGYNYSEVVKEFAKMADLIVLMFDPHKAGTIQETYNAIRNTLPEATGEDRILFVMSRIDECDNMADLVRSYGTLCWNLSQMTGRKDIPRVFLTFSPAVVETTPELLTWAEERESLKEKVRGAPSLRISHILESVDKQIGELKMTAEAMWSFSEGGKKIVNSNTKRGLVTSLLCFFLLDLITREFLGFPEKTMVSSLMTGVIDLSQFIIPAAGFVGMGLLFSFCLFKWQLPRYFNRCRTKPESLIVLDSVYRNNVWDRVKGKVDDGQEKL